MDNSRFTKHVTADELMAMPSDDKRYELVNGELRTMPFRGGRHGRIAQKLLLLLGNHVEQHDLGETFAAGTGFLLGRNPDTVRAPDVAFVSRERLGSLADEPGFLPLAPDLVAEVVSPGDRASEVEEKANAWLAAGVIVVLVVDPQAKTIRDFRAPTEIRLYCDGDLIDLQQFMPGFRLDVGELFR